MCCWYHFAESGRHIGKGGCLLPEEHTTARVPIVWGAVVSSCVLGADMVLLLLVVCKVAAVLRCLALPACSQLLLPHEHLGELLAGGAALARLGFGCCRLGNVELLKGGLDGARNSRVSKHQRVHEHLAACELFAAAAICDCAHPQHIHFWDFHELVLYMGTLKGTWWTKTKR